MNDYYDPALKEYRLAKIQKTAKESYSEFDFIKGSLEDKVLLELIFIENSPDIVINLAAQAGVRYSIENPDVYIVSAK